MNILDQDIIARMRNNLQPKGTAPIVILRPMGIGLELHADFVTKCIDELERMPLMVEALGHEPTNLEKLAYMLLADSAYIETTATRRSNRTE